MRSPKHKLLAILLTFTIGLLAQNKEASNQDFKDLYQGTMSNAAFVKPKNADGLVFDYAAMLSKQENNAIEQKLQAYSDSTGTQIVVFTVDQLGKFDLELTAAKIGESWGVGQREEDNGMVILISQDDRLITMQGGYGMMSKMPATLKKIIIDQHFAPNFRKGDYYQGIDQATNAIFAILAGQYKAPPKQEENKAIPLAIVFIGFILFFLVLYLATKYGKGGGGPRRGGRRYRNTWEDVIISNTGSRNWGGNFGGGSFGGSSGGGFGGFGGGSFGGGGASGSW